MSQKWAYLDAFTYDTAGNERRVNHANEWGGYSRVLQMPVFTAWRDHTTFDRETKFTTAIVANSALGRSKVGVNNQERWVDYALAQGGQAAFFIIHAVDENATPRVIAAIDADRAISGPIRREGTLSIISGQPRKI